MEHTEQEVLEVIKATKEDRKTQAERTNQLFLKYKKWLKQTYETTDFQQPVMLFIRRSGEVEFYEKTTSGLFEYKHSDGTSRYLILTPSKQLKFGFADKTFKGYITHEDYPLPLPNDPFLTVDQVNIMVDKALNDIKEWKAKEINAQGEFWWKIIIGIAILAAVFVLYTIVVPQPTPAATTAVTTIKDTTITALNVTKVI